MATETKPKSRLSDVYKANAARLRVKAKKAKAASAAEAGADVDVGVAAAETSETSSKTPKSQSKAKPKSKGKKTNAEPTERRRLRADQLQWKAVNTSSLPGMDGGGGMMMLEELDGVAVEWTEDAEGRKTARFMVSPRAGV
jgi:ATP-dependent RNA helicase DDX24/MAK5